MEVSGGTVNDTTVTGGYFVLSGGTINKLSIEKGSGCVSSGGGTINDLTLSGGFISFYSGTINRATVDHGDIYCYSGGKVNSATFNGGRLVVSSNCTANKITLENSATMDVYQSKAKASGVTVRTGGSMYLDSGAVVTNLTFEGGDADPAKDKYSGRLAAHRGTIIKGLTIGSGTSIGLFTGCTATKVKWTPGDGVVNIWSASVSFTSKYSCVYLGSDGCHVSSQTRTKEILFETVGEGKSAYIAKGGMAEGTTIENFGSMFVWSGGKAVKTDVGYNGFMDVSSGGSAETVKILKDGYLGIFGGKASDITICNGGYMFLCGGDVSGIRLEYGGDLLIDSGGTVTDIDWTPFDGTLWIGDDAHYTFANEITGVYIGRGMTYHKHEEKVQNWTANDDADTLYVMSGGIVEGTRIEAGSMYVFGGSALGTVLTDVSYGGYMYLYEGAYASGTKIQSGRLDVYSGGTADHTTISKGQVIVYKSGLASDTNVFGGRLTISGGSASGSKRSASLQSPRTGHLTICG